MTGSDRKEVEIYTYNLLKTQKVWRPFCFSKRSSMIGRNGINIENKS